MVGRNDTQRHWLEKGGPKNSLFPLATESAALLVSLAAGKRVLPRVPFLRRAKRLSSWSR
jgi:hypothetical protein